jgi:hypothetical protein
MSRRLLLLTLITATATRRRNMSVSFNEVWEELVRAEGNKNDETEAFGIESRHHGVDFETWPPTESQAYNWYFQRVWCGLGIADLPAPIQIDAFLFALNVSLVRGEERNAAMTSPRMVRALQATLNALGHKVKIDEQLGPKTLRALKRTPHVDKLLATFRGACCMYYSSLPAFPRYGESWLRRMEPA